MVNVYLLESQARQAMLDGLVDAYKQQHPGWLAKPAIRKFMLIDACQSWPALVWIAVIALASTTFIIFGASAALMAAIVAAIVLLLSLILGIWTLAIMLKDEARQTRAVARLLQSNVVFSLDAIQDKRLQAKLYKALHYWSLISDSIQHGPAGILGGHGLATRRDITRWLQNIYCLAHRIDEVRLNPIIKRDLQQLPLIIERCQQRLKQEANPLAQQQLEQTLAHQEKLLQTLQTLQANIEQAGHEIDNTISALGVICSQLLLVSADSGAQGGRSRRLQLEISEEIGRLQDLAEAMAEVYQSS